MKVVYILHYPGFGGANIAALCLAQELRVRFGVVPVFLVPMRGQVVDRIREAGFDYYILRFASWRGPRSGLLGLLYAIVTTIVNYFAALTASHILSGTDIELIHANTSLCGFAWFLSRRLGKPLVWHQREFGEEHYGLKYYYGKWIAGRILGQSDAVLTVSGAMAEYYKGFVRPVEKVAVVYDGISTSGVNERLQELVPPVGECGEFRICMVGGISSGKNQIEVLNALEHLKACGKVGNMHFYLLGAGTREYENYIRSRAAVMGLTDRIHFLGHHSNVWPYLKQMHCAVCASRREGFGLAVVEAMYAQLPIVAANAGSMPELVVHGVTGYLYPSGDYKEMANCLIRVSQGELGENQRIASRARVVDNFTAEKNAIAVMEVYKRVLGRNTP